MVKNWLILYEKIFRWTKTSWNDTFQALDKDSEPTAYIFRCLHCGTYFGYSDFTQRLCELKPFEGEVFRVGEALERGVKRRFPTLL